MLKGHHIGRLAGFILTTLILPCLAGVYLGPEVAWISAGICLILWLLFQEKSREKTKQWSEALERKWSHRPRMYVLVIATCGAVFGFVVFGGAAIYLRSPLPRPSVPGGNMPLGTSSTAAALPKQPINAVGPRSSPAQVHHDVTQQSKRTTWEEQQKIAWTKLERYRKAHPTSLRTTVVKDVNKWLEARGYAVRIAADTNQPDGFTLTSQVPVAPKGLYPEGAGLVVMGADSHVEGNETSNTANQGIFVGGDRSTVKGNWLAKPSTKQLFVSGARQKMFPWGK